MSEKPTNTKEPDNGKWSAEQLLGLIKLEVETAQDLRGARRQSQLAMKIAQRTGCSYSWAWREIERLAGGPRWDGG